MLMISFKRILQITLKTQSLIFDECLVKIYVGIHLLTPMDNQLGHKDNKQNTQKLRILS